MTRISPVSTTGASVASTTTSSDAVTAALRSRASGAVTSRWTAARRQIGRVGSSIARWAPDTTGTSPVTSATPRSEAPHSMQNFCPWRTSVPHD